jgi:hypothetical protein
MCNMFDLNTWPLPTPAAYRVNSEQHLQQLNGDRDCRFPGAPVQFLCVDTRYFSHGRCRIKLAAKAALLNHLSMHCNLVLGIGLLFGWLLDRGLECANISARVKIEPKISTNTSSLKSQPTGPRPKRGHCKPSHTDPNLVGP